MIDALAVAKFLFERNASNFTDDRERIEQAWNEDEGVKKFWTEEAEAVLGFLVQGVLS